MKWFRVEFDLGIEEGDEFPSDPMEFMKWLTIEPVKYVDGLRVRDAKLEWVDHEPWWQ